MNRDAKQKKEKEKPEFLEGTDFYYEKGLMVLTGHFLRKRGYCCRNNCRHCPYTLEKESLSTEL
ncbi:MAG: hypothetical protein JWN60_2100 [Acidobacteria bacterium]|jgi:hypothetical protein|nr:hypothetical protein [Acidobacteriota bacterium]